MGGGGNEVKETQVCGPCSNSQKPTIVHRIPHLLWSDLDTLIVPFGNCFRIEWDAYFGEYTAAVKGTVRDLVVSRNKQQLIVISGRAPADHAHLGAVVTLSDTAGWGHRAVLWLRFTCVDPLEDATVDADATAIASSLNAAPVAVFRNIKWAGEAFLDLGKEKEEKDEGVATQPPTAASGSSEEEKEEKQEEGPSRTASGVSLVTASCSDECTTIPCTCWPRELKASCIRFNMKGALSRLRLGRGDRFVVTVPDVEAGCDKIEMTGPIVAVLKDGRIERSWRDATTLVLTGTIRSDAPCGLSVLVRVPTLALGSAARMLRIGTGKQRIVDDEHHVVPCPRDERHPLPDDERPRASAPLPVPKQEQPVQPHPTVTLLTQLERDAARSLKAAFCIWSLLFIWGVLHAITR